MVSFLSYVIQKHSLSSRGRGIESIDLIVEELSPDSFLCDQKNPLEHHNVVKDVLGL